MKIGFFVRRLIFKFVFRIFLRAHTFLHLISILFDKLTTLIQQICIHYPSIHIHISHDDSWMKNHSICSWKRRVFCCIAGGSTHVTQCYNSNKVLPFHTMYSTKKKKKIRRKNTHTYPRCCTLLCQSSVCIHNASTHLPFSNEQKKKITDVQYDLPSVHICVWLNEGCDAMLTRCERSKLKRI